MDIQGDPAFTPGSTSIDWSPAMISRRFLLVRSIIPMMILCLWPMAGAQTASVGQDQQVVMKPTAFRVGDYLIQGDRGRLFVKENRNNTNSGTIQIAFVRLRHPEPGPGREAPLVYLPGGPGQPVLDHIENFAATYQNYLNIGGRGDMLVVEQRGIGASHPRLDCPGVLSRPIDLPLSAEVMGSTHRRYIEDCLKRWIDKGVDPSGYNVVSMADDVDELRAALGYDQIKIVGESFGSHHALAVINRHPDKVERAALAAVIGPDDMFEMPSVVERQLAKVEKLAFDADHRDSNLSMTSILAGFDTPKNVSVPTDRGDLALEIGRYDLALATVTFSRQTAFLQQLPGLYDMVSRGDLSWLARWSAKVRQGHPSNLASLLITCASGASKERRALIKAEAADSLIGDAVDLLGADACAPVAELELGDAFRRPITTDIPMLLMSGALDLRAPPSNAEAILKGLSKGQHVVFPNVAHDFGEARDVQLDLTYRFLAHGDTQPNPALMP